MNGRAWSTEEIEALTRNPPIPAHIIARRYGRSLQHVYNKRNRLKSGADGQSTQVKPRKCLHCGKVFERKSRFLFLCPDHRSVSGDMACHGIASGSRRARGAA